MPALSSVAAPVFSVPSACSAFFEVRIVQAPKGAWYENLVGHVLIVSKVQAQFEGHVYKYNMFEVAFGFLENSFYEGDYLWPAHCEVVE